MRNQVTPPPLRWLAGLALGALTAMSALPLAAQSISAPLTVTTFAGAAGQAQATDATGTAARFWAPSGIIIDGSGNLIIADAANNIIRKATPAGVVTTFAGSPIDLGSRPINSGNANGTGGEAAFYFGQFLTVNGAWTAFSSPPNIGSNTLGVDGSGNVYLADTINNTVRKITPAGVVTTLAGEPGAMGTDDGTGGAARFLAPAGVAADASGNVYVADSGNNTIRKVTPAGVVTTFAGTARTFGTTDGTGAAARFSNPAGIAIDPANGTLYVSDYGNHTIRKITAAGVVTTLAGMGSQKGTADGTGTQARFNNPTALAVDSSGNVLVADTGNHAIRKISATGSVTTVAGLKGTSGSADGTGTAARFNTPYGIAVDSTGRVYISDSLNHTIRTAVPAASSGSLQITGVPPAIIQAVVNTSVTLKIAATGTPAPTYQWSKNGTAIAGATNATLTLNSVTATDQANYTVLVTSDTVTFSSAPTQLQVFAEGTAVPVTIVTQPASRTVAAGQSTTFTVEASSARPLTYQWKLNDSPIAGATASSYTIASAQTEHAGSYTVTVSDGVTESSTTAGATLTVTGGTPATAPTITVQPIAKTVDAGATVTFTSGASGSPAPTFQWQKNGTNVANGDHISGATTASLTITGVTAADVGEYKLLATNTAGTALSAGAALALNVAPPPPPPGGPTAWLSNLSVRMNNPAGQPLQAGFTVRDGTLPVLVRAIGPGLIKTWPQWFNAGNVQADPRAAFYPNGASTPSATNDNWDSSLSEVIAAVGGYPLDAGSKDAVLRVNIRDNNNAVIAEGTSGGNIVIEAYAIESKSSPRLSNLSARNRVAGEPLIAGFAIGGTGKKRLLIRGIGPQLNVNWGIDALADPKLEIYRDQTLIASNDNWTSDLAAVFESVGAYSFKADSKDAAIVVELDANAAYTAQVKRVGENMTGEAVVEVYELP